MQLNANVFFLKKECILLMSMDSEWNVNWKKIIDHI